VIKKYYHIPISFITILLGFMLLQNVIYAQKFVQDTLWISFASTDLVKPVAHVVIDSVIDQRREETHLLARYEKKKFLFIPVDLVVCTKMPLNHEILAALKQPNFKPIDSLKFKIIIDEFILSRKTNSFIYPRYILNASISFFRQSSGSFSEYMG
jgi:hypothetical protein